MIYLKNNTETQAIYIPRQTVLGGGYIPSTKAYDKGYNDGLEVGKEQQKGKLSNLNVTENGQYEREDGWNVVNVDVPDLNGSYSEGYEQGKTDGIDEQKGKLESISITENGVYSKEDGYNHIEVNVPSYEQGQADMAAKARVLNVTKNGNYLSKFSDPIIPANVTGVYADDTKFYSYALISNIIYSTGIIPNQNTRLEFWFKPYGTEYEDWEIIIGSQRGDDTTDTFQVRRYATNRYDFVAEIGTSEVRFTMSENKWYHIIMSVADGFVLDGTKIGDFTENMTESNTPLQIGGSINFNGQRTEEGYYGMIKIDDNIIIPTENGFKNVTTGQILQILKDGDYTFTKNLPTYGEGEIYKTINVNVPDLNGSYEQGKTDGVNEQKSKLESINITENGTYTKEDGYNHIEVNVPTEAVSCNLEDKWVTPSMNDRDSNGYIVVRPSEGYDGLSRTVIDPKTIYYEGAEISGQIQETKLVTPSINDLDVNGYIVVMPNKGYAAMGRVVINVSTIKSEWITIGENSIKNYYWCPLTVSDGGIGERAKYFSLANEQTVYDENDVLIDRNNMFYLPTANNLNEFRLTKKAVKIVFPFKNEDAQHIGNLYLNDDVEQFACADKNLSSLSIIEVGINMARFTLSNCNLLNLNKIVVHSNNNCDVTLTHNVKSTGTLYVNESNQFKNNWINALPSGWTVEYI